MMSENFRKCFKCGRSPAKENVRLFRFPKPGVKNLFRCKMWAKYMFPEEHSESLEFQKKLYSEHRMLCQYHFQSKDFTDSTMKKLSRNSFPHDINESFMSPVHDIQPNLIPAACLVPVHLEPQPGPSNRSPLRDVINIQQPSHASTSQSIITPRAKTQRENILYGKCMKYMKRVCQLRNTIKKLRHKAILNILSDDNFIKKLSKKITPTFALLLQAQIRNYNKKGSGHRWTKEEKIVALRIYKRSPTCYRLLRRLFNLPSPGTLKLVLNSVHFRVGISQPVINVLSAYIKTIQPSDNEFVLMFDEMSLKKHLEYSSKQDLIEGYQDHGHQGRSPIAASYALVFMIAGIRKNVKQPIAHYLSSGFSTADRLTVLIKEVLHSCFQAGINIRATVCDMDGVNRRALSILGASSQEPHFNIENKEIITIYDVPHLLKCFRNLFMKYNIESNADISSENKIGKGIAKWSHIKDFYELDNNNPNFVFAPSLTKEHLEPNTQQKMRVELAAQVFSHTVAAGIFAKIADGSLSTDIVLTANIISNMDKLFDCLNSDTSDLRRGKPCATNMSKFSPHLKMFAQMRKFFSTMKFIDCPRKPPSQEGWIWTLNAIEKLFRQITNEHKNVKSVTTRRLQQDPLENLFGCIRGNCGSNRNPTSIQFVAGLKTAILTSMAHVGTIGNCERDNNIIINNFHKLLGHSQPRVIHTRHEYNSDHIELAQNIKLEDIEEDSAEIQACAYVCGFLLKRHHLSDCANCTKIFVAQNVEKHHLFIENKEYYELKKKLMYASKDMILCVEQCASLINKYLEENGHKTDLKYNIGQYVRGEVSFNFLRTCQEHEDENLKNIIDSVFAICIKRFCILRNRHFKDETSASALKRKMNILMHK